MTWTVIYHPAVRDDLDVLGPAVANQILNVIEERIIHGEPEKAGKPLRHDLAGCRRIRTGSYRIIYRVDRAEVEVLIVAVGARDKERAYKKARKRKGP